MSHVHLMGTYVTPAWHIRPRNSRLSTRDKLSFRRARVDAVYQHGSTIFLSRKNVTHVWIDARRGIYLKIPKFWNFFVVFFFASTLISTLLTQYLEHATYGQSIRKFFYTLIRIFVIATINFQWKCFDELSGERRNILTFDSRRCF